MDFSAAPRYFGFSAFVTFGSQASSNETLSPSLTCRSTLGYNPVARMLVRVLSKGLSSLLAFIKHHIAIGKLA